jgi:transcription initiation factor TFIIIB Brf1 subunit/transcription initiation factor TFIIB
MQKKQAMKLQEAWGAKPCDHPTFAKEYDLGERTGNYVCAQCGAVLTFRERAEAIAARAN